MKTSEFGKEFIQQREGISKVIYDDIAGKPTIGFGHLIKDGEEFTTITLEQAQELFDKDIAPFEDCVNTHVTVPLKQYQFDALVSFSYNLGCKSLVESTLLKKLNAGFYDDAAREFLKWNHAGGKEAMGLTIRRGKEMGMFLGNLTDKGTA